MGRPPSPFDHIKFRYVAGYLILGVVPFVVINAFQNSVLTDAATFLWIHGTIFWWARKQIVSLGMNVSDVFGRFKLSYVWLIVGSTVLMIFLSYGVILLYYFGITSLFGDTFLDVINTSVVESRLGVILGILFVPYVEEFFFRGVLMQTMVVRLGFVKGIILSSLIFGVAHFEFISATIFGIVLALVYIKFKNLWVPIAIHTLNNAVAFLPILLFSQSENVTAAELTASDTLYVGLLIVGMVLPTVLYFIYRWWPSKGEVIPYVYNSNSNLHDT